MPINVGLLDRILRIVLGLVLIAFAVRVFGEEYQTPWGWIGLVPVISGYFRFCPFYAILGLSTHKSTQTKSKPPAS